MDINGFASNASMMIYSLLWTYFIMNSNPIEINSWFTWYLFGKLSKILKFYGELIHLLCTVMNFHFD